MGQRFNLSDQFLCIVLNMILLLCTVEINLSQDKLIECSDEMKRIIVVEGFLWPDVSGSFNTFIHGLAKEEVQKLFHQEAEIKQHKTKYSGVGIYAKVKSIQPIIAVEKIINECDMKIVSQSQSSGKGNRMFCWSLSSN